MGTKIRKPREILEACFTRLEWEYLMQNPEFAKDFKDGCETLKDVETLSLLGHRIITNWEMASPGKPPLPHLGKKKGDQDSA